MPQPTRSYWQLPCCRAHASFFFSITTVILLPSICLRTLATSRKQTFDPRPKWALVPEFFAPGTRDIFSPGWWLQPGLKVPAQWLLRQTEVAGTFSPGWSHQPGVKVYL